MGEGCQKILKKNKLKKEPRQKAHPWAQYVSDTHFQFLSPYLALCFFIAFITTWNQTFALSPEYSLHHAALYSETPAPRIVRVYSTQITHAEWTKGCVDGWIYERVDGVRGICSRNYISITLSGVRHRFCSCQGWATITTKQKKHSLEVLEEKNIQWDTHITEATSTKAAASFQPKTCGFGGEYALAVSTLLALAYKWPLECLSTNLGEVLKDNYLRSSWNRVLIESSQSSILTGIMAHNVNEISIINILNTNISLLSVGKS